MANQVQTIEAVLESQEQERLEALRRYEILDSEPEQNFDDLTQLAGFICQTPVALITLVDEDRQWFKSNLGFSVSETPRDVSFCSHAITSPKMMVVKDALTDPRFANNPLVTGDPNIRFYAGMPLYTADHQHALGTLCVIDRVPRELTKTQQDAIVSLARQAQALLELRLSLKREMSIARIDSLTGIPNRRAFYELLGREVSRLERHGRPFSVVYFDLDNFKAVNDRSGHSAGDDVLSTVASTVRRHLRRTDSVCRMGGDEFAILLAESDAQVAKNVTKKIADQLQDAMHRNNWPVTFSMGVVTCVAPLSSLDELIKTADGLMYQSKNAGKNSVHYSVCPKPILIQ